MRRGTWCIWCLMFSIGCPMTSKVAGCSNLTSHSRWCSIIEQKSNKHCKWSSIAKIHLLKISLFGKINHKSTRPKKSSNTSRTTLSFTISKNRRQLCISYLFSLRRWVRCVKQKFNSMTSTHLLTRLQFQVKLLLKREESELTPFLLKISDRKSSHPYS